jgi:uncharacterized delta-60 repeat protein
MKFLSTCVFVAASLFSCLVQAKPGDLDLSFDPGAGVDGVVYSIAPQVDGKILIAGIFTKVNGIGRDGVARLNQDGSLDPTFAPAQGGSFYSVVAQADGKVIVGGSSLQRLNPDGSVDGSFNANPNDVVFTVAIQPDGKVLIGGWFVSVNGLARNRIARLNADGSLDQSFDPGQGATSTTQYPAVYSIVPQNDGKVLVGGDFSTMAATPRQGIARLNIDGSLDASFNPDLGADIHSIALQPDGRILVGGAWSFETFSGLARLNTDGTTDTNFTLRTVAANIHSVVFSPTDGKGLFGGCTSQVSRFADNGDIDLGFNRRLLDYASEYCWCCPAVAPILSMAVQADGNVLIGGAFTSVGGVSRRGIARLLGGPSNRFPVADVNGTKPMVISSNGTNMVITLDGSRSFDPDGDPLDYGWFEFWPTEWTFLGFATNGLLSTTLPVGKHHMLLFASDGSLAGWAAMGLEVMTIPDSIERLISELDASGKHSQPLKATLAAALQSARRGNTSAALGSLGAFQHQVKARAMTPSLANQLLASSQSIVDALTEYTQAIPKKSRD